MRGYLHLHFVQYGRARTPLVILIHFFMCNTKNWPHFIVKHWNMTSQEIERLRIDINASYCNLQQQFAYNRLCFLVISNARHFYIILLINLKLNDGALSLWVMTTKCINAASYESYVFETYIQLMFCHSFQKLRFLWGTYFQSWVC